MASKNWLWAAGVVVAIGATVAVTLAVTKPATAPPPAATFTMRGSIDLQNGLKNIALLQGKSCSGKGGYSDLTAGSEVTVKNTTGQVVATGALATGTLDGSTSTTTFGCALTFEVRDVPDGLSSYSLTVTHRGTQVFPNDQAHGFVRLTIG
jgi:hypothetical protein